ncbi:MAG: Rrf2 family transcriptional regulator [Lachnospiraceae bacterium]|nr:Rrf2 family transcriptional regulator [Lachnospiraceae bacterium]
MKFSRKSRYGLSALIDLAVNSKTEQVSLCSIAKRNSISPQYLEQIFANLRRAGIVKSIKGSQGGYFLKGSPSEITVAQVLEALEGDYHIEAEKAPEDSSSPGVSVTIQTRVIDEINRKLDDVLQNVTLADLEQDYLENEAYNQNMYYI